MAIQATQQTEYREETFPSFEIPEIKRLDDPRFFVQFVDDVMGVDTNAIPGRALRRGVIMPCVSFTERLPLVEIREADLIHGSKEADGITGREYYGRVWRRAQIEADRLVDLERGADHKLGIREVAALRRLPSLYQKRINSLFYSGLDWMAVETNEAMLQHLRARVASLRSNPPKELSSAEVSTLNDVGEELIEACKYADEVQRSYIEMIHALMKLPPSDPFSLAGRTGHECYGRYRLFLKRTGLKALSETDQQMAGALEKLSNIQPTAGDSDIKQLLGTMNSLLTALLNERSEAKNKGGK